MMSQRFVHGLLIVCSTSTCGLAQETDPFVTELRNGFAVEVVAEELPYEILDIRRAPANWGSFGGDLILSNQGPVASCPATVGDGRVFALTEAGLVFPIIDPGNGVDPQWPEFAPRGTFGDRLFLPGHCTQNANLHSASSDGTVELFGSPGGAGVAFSIDGPFGLFAYAGNGQEEVYRFSEDGTASLFHDFNMQCATITGVAFGPGGDFGPGLYVALATCGVYTLDSVGTPSPFITPADDPTLQFIADLRFGEGGAFGTNMFVLETSSNSILEITGSGEVSTLLARSQQSSHIYFDGETSLYYADNNGANGVTLYRVSPAPCDSIADCADLDENGIRDDGCVWWSCNNNLCQGTDIVYADMGGFNGACPPDGTADANDRFHTLNCFSNQDTLQVPGYPCEDDPPAAYNVDSAGLGFPCMPDGVCDGNDAFAALNAFENNTTCTCSGPAPTPVGELVVTATAVIGLEPDRTRIRPGGIVEVDVFLDSALDDLRGYQLHVAASGGDRGSLGLIDISVVERDDHVFAELADWRAFNVSTAQMLAGLDTEGVEARSGDYLATFTFQASEDATGMFWIELQHDLSESMHRTILFPTDPGEVIDGFAHEVGIIVVGGSKRNRLFGK